MRWTSFALSLIFFAQVAFGHLPLKNNYEEHASASLPGNVSLRATKGSEAISPFPPSLLQYVRVSDFLPQPGKPLVCLLRDIHLNEEAQRNMAGALDVIAPLLIGVEGTVGPLDFSPFHKLPRQDVVKTIAAHFLKEGRVGAVATAGLMLGKAKNSRFVGLESASLYRDNVLAYREAMEHKEKLELTLQKMESEHARDLATYLRPPLLQWAKRKADFDAGRISLGAYASALLKNSAISSPLLHLETFVAAFELEHTLDFANADQERTHILQRLAAQLSIDETQLFTSQALAFKRGEIRLAEYYGFLKNWLEKKHIELKSYPTFDRYLRYVFLSDGIRIDQLYAELKEGEIRSLAALHPTEQEKRLIQQGRRLSLTRKLLDFALTPEEWGEYKEYPIHTPPNLPTVRRGEELAPFESFYRLAEARNQAMVENLLSSFGDDDVAVLIAGGFHTPGLKRLLEAKGFSTVILTPHLTKVDTAHGSDYLRVFLKEKSPLQKLFAGRKLFLALPETIGSKRELQPVIPELREGVKAEFYRRYNPSSLASFTPLLFLGWLFPSTKNQPLLEGALLFVLFIFVVCVVMLADGPPEYPENRPSQKHPPIDIERLKSIHPPPQESLMNQPITTIAHSHTGEYMAIGTYDTFNGYLAPVIKLIETTSGHVKLALFPQAARETFDADEPLMQIKSIAFTPNEDIVAAADWNGNIYLWNIKNGELLTKKSLSHDGAHVSSIAISPDGQWLASAGLHNSVILWNIKDPKNIRKHSRLPHKGVVFCVAFRPDGRNLVTGGRVPDDRHYYFRVYNREPSIQANEYKEYDAGPGVVRAFAFSPDGGHMALGYDSGTVKLIDLRTGSTRTLGNHQGGVLSLAFSLDNRVLVSGGVNNHIKLWDLKTGKSITTFYGHNNGVTSLSFSPDGTLASASNGKEKQKTQGTLIEWNLTRSASRDVTPLEKQRIIDVEALVQQNPTALEFVKNKNQGDIKTAAFYPTKNLLAVAVREKTISNFIWTLRFFDLIRHQELPVSVINWAANSKIIDIIDLVFSPDENTLAVHLQIDEDQQQKEAVRILDMTKRQWAGNPLLTPHLTSLALGPDHLQARGERGRVVLSHNTNGSVHELEESNVSTLAFDAEEGLLAMGKHDGEVSLWDTQTKKCLNRKVSISSPVLKMAFNMDGTLLASAHQNGKVTIRTIGMAELSATLQGELKDVNMMTFSPNNQLLATLSKHSVIQIWDVKTGNRLGTLPLLDDKNITTISFSHYGVVFYAIDKDGLILKWMIPYHDTHPGSSLSPGSPTSPGPSNPPLFFAPLALIGFFLDIPPEARLVLWGLSFLAFVWLCGGMSMGMVAQGFSSFNRIPRPQIPVTLIDSYKQASTELFQALLDLNENSFEAAHHRLLNSAKEVSSYGVPETELDKQLTNDHRNRQVPLGEGRHLALPPITAKEILSLGADSQRLTRPMTRRLKQGFAMIWKAFPENQRKDVKKVLADIQLRSTNGPDLIKLETFRTSIRELNASSPSLFKVKALGKVLTHLAENFLKAGSSFPDFATDDSGRMQLVLEPREDLDVLGVVALHEVVHGLCRLKAFDVPFHSEIVTEAMTIMEIVRTMGEGEDIFTKIGKRGASLYLRTAGKWVAQHLETDEQGSAGLERLFAEAEQTVLDNWEQFGFESLTQAEAMALNDQGFRERQTGLLLGAILLTRHGLTIKKGTYPALQALILYANTTLSRAFEDEEDAVGFNPQLEQERRAQLKSEFEAITGIKNCAVQPWRSRALIDTAPRWQVVFPAVASEKPVAVEYPPQEIFGEEAMVLFRGLSLAHAGKEEKDMPIEGRLRNNPVFGQLLKAVLTMRAEALVVAHRPGRMETFRKLVRRIYPNIHSPAAKDRFQKLPFYLQYLEALQYEARMLLTRALDPDDLLLDPRVDPDSLVGQALRQSRMICLNLFETQEMKLTLEAPDAYEITRDTLWPLMQDLYEKSEHAALAQEFWSHSQATKATRDIIQRLQDQGLLENQTEGNADGSLDDLLKQQLQQAQQDVLQALAKEARDIQDDEERGKLAKKAQDRLMKAEEDLADKIEEQAQQAQALDQFRQQLIQQMGQALAHSVLSQMGQTLSGLEQDLPEVDTAAKNVEGLARGVGSLAQDIRSQVTAPTSGPQNPENPEAGPQAQSAASLVRAAQDLPGQTENLKTQIEKIRRKTQATKTNSQAALALMGPTSTSQLPGPSDEMNKNAEDMDRLAQQALESGQALNQMARDLQQQIEAQGAEGDSIAGQVAQAQRVGEKSQSIADQARDIQNKNQELEGILKELQAAVKKTQDALRPSAPEENGDSHLPLGLQVPPESITGDQSEEESLASEPIEAPSPPSVSPPAPEPSNSVLDDLMALTTRARSTPPSDQQGQPAPITEEKARAGFTTQEWGEWQAFINPMTEVIAHLRKRFAGSINKVMDPTQRTSLPRGTMHSPAVHRALIDGRSYRRESTPEKIHILLDLLLDASGSMGEAQLGNPKTTTSNLYKTAQWYAAIAIAALTAAETTVWSNVLHIDANMRGFAEEANIPLLDYGTPFTEKAIYDAVKILFDISNRGDTADVPTFRQAAQDLATRSRGSGIAAKGLIIGTDGHRTDQQHIDAIREIQNAEDNRDIEALVYGLGQGAEPVVPVWKSEDHPNFRTRFVGDLDSLQVEETLDEIGEWFDRLMNKATPQQQVRALPDIKSYGISGIALALITEAIPHSSSWHSTVFLVVAFWVIVAFFMFLTSPPTISFPTSPRKPYRYETIGGRRYLRMEDKNGNWARLQVREDTKKILFTNGLYQWEMERHRITAKNTSTGEHVEGQWMGQEWRWFQYDSQNQLTGISQPPEELGLSIENDKVLVYQEASKTHLLCSGSFFSQDDSFWKWTPSNSVPFQEQRGSHIPVVQPHFDRQGNEVPNAVQLTIAGKKRVVTLTDRYVSQLVQMMQILSSADPSHTNLALVGHKSTGKNTAFYLLAGLVEQPVRTLSLHAHSTVHDFRWMQTVGLFQPGKTDKFIGLFYEAAQLGHWILVDELDKARDPSIVTSVVEMLESRMDHFPDGTAIVGRKYYRAGFNWNDDDDPIYMTQTLDGIGDFKSRVNKVYCSFPSPEEEREWILNSVFENDDQATIDRYFGLVTALTHIAKAIRDHANTSEGKRARIPPVDPRQLHRMMLRLRRLPQLTEYVRDIFFLDYPLIAVAERERDNLKRKVEEFFNDYLVKEVEDSGVKKMVPILTKRFFNDDGDVSIQIGRPKVEANSVVFGTPETGEIRRKQGNLPLGQGQGQDFEVYMDLPSNQLQVFFLAIDEELGFHNMLLGEKGAGKSKLITYFQKALLRNEIEEPPQMDTATQGDDITGAQELLDSRSVFPATAVERAMKRGRVLYQKEITKARPDVHAAYHNIMEFGFSTFAGLRETAAIPGFRITFDGNLNTQDTSVNDLGAAFSSRAVIYERKSLGPKEALLFIEIEEKRLKDLYGPGSNQSAADVPYPWHDLTQEGRVAIRDAYVSLRAAGKRTNNRLLLTVDMRPIKRFIDHLGRFPELAQNIEAVLCNLATITGETQIGLAQIAMWPLARLRFGWVIEHLPDNRKLSTEYGQALIICLSYLAQKTDDWVDVSGNKKARAFPFVPSNQQVNLVVSRLLGDAEKHLTLSKVAEAISDVLGLTAAANPRECQVVKEAVERSTLHLHVTQHARIKATQVLKETLSEASRTHHLDPRLHEPLLKMGEELVKAVADEKLQALPQGEALGKFVEDLRADLIEKSGKAVAATLARHLNTTDANQGTALHSICRNTGLHDIAARLAEEAAYREEQQFLADVGLSLEAALKEGRLDPRLAEPIQAFAGELPKLKNSNTLATLPSTVQIDEFVTALDSAHLLLTIENLQAAVERFLTSTHAKPAIGALLTHSKLEETARLIALELQPHHPVDWGLIEEAVRGEWERLSEEGRQVVAEEFNDGAASLDLNTQVPPLLESGIAQSVEMAAPPLLQALLSVVFSNNQLFPRLPEPPAPAVVTSPMVARIDKAKLKEWGNPLPKNTFPNEFNKELGDREVKQVAYSADGMSTFILAAKNDGSKPFIQVVDPRLPHGMVTYAPTMATVQRFAVNPNLNNIAFIYEKNRVRLCPLRDRGIEFAADQDLQGSYGDINDIAFSPDGRYLVAAGQNGRLYLWDLHEEEPVAKDITYVGMPLTRVAFSKDGILAVGTEERGIRLLDMNTLDIHQTSTRTAAYLYIPASESKVTELTFRPDGTSLFAAYSDGTGAFWDINPAQLTNQHAPQNTIHNHGVRNGNGRFSSDGSVFAFRDPGLGLLYFYDISDMNQHRLITTLDTSDTDDLQFSPDGRRILFGTMNKGVQEFELPVLPADDSSPPRTEGEGRGQGWGVLAFLKSILSNLNHARVAMLEAKFSQRATTTGVSAPSTAAPPTIAAKIDLEALKKLTPDEIKFQPLMVDGEELKNVTAMALSPDGTMLAVAKSDDLGYVTVDVLDPNTGSSVLTHSERLGRSRITVLAFAPERNFLAIGYVIGYVQTIRLAQHWNAPTEERKFTFESMGFPSVENRKRVHDGPITALVFSPDDKKLVSGSSDKHVKVWDLVSANTDPIQSTKYDHEITAIAANESEFTVAEGPNSETYNWSILRKTSGFNSPHMDPKIESLVTSPDGTHLIYTGNGIVRETRIAYNKKNHPKVRKAVVSHDGRFLASIGGDNFVTIWERDSQIGIKNIHFSNPMDVMFHPNGTLIVRGGDGTIKTWQLPVEGGNPPPPRPSDVPPTPMSTTTDPHLERLLTLLKELHELATDTLNDLLFPVRATELTAPEGTSPTIDFEKLKDLKPEEVNVVFEALKPLAINGRITAFAASPDKKRLAFGYKALRKKKNRTIVIYEHEGHAKVAIANHGFAAELIAFSPEGTGLVTWTEDNQLNVKHLREHWGLFDSLYLDTIPNVTAIDWSSKNLISYSVGQEVYFIRDLQGQPTDFDVGASVTSLKSSPDGNLLAVGHEDGSIGVWDVTDRLNPKKVASRKLFRGPVISLSFHPGGNKILCNSSNLAEGAALWDLSINPLQQPPSGEADQAVKKLAGLWSGKPTAFILDGKYIVRAERPAVIDFWDSETGQRVGHLPTCSLEPKCLVHDPSEGTLTVFSADGHGQRWKLPLVGPSSGPSPTTRLPPFPMRVLPPYVFSPLPLLGLILDLPAEARLVLWALTALWVWGLVSLRARRAKQSLPSFLPTVEPLGLGDLGERLFLGQPPKQREAQTLHSRFRARRTILKSV